MELNKFLAELGYTFGTQVRIVEELPDMEGYLAYLLKKEAQVFSRLSNLEDSKKDMVYKLLHSIRAILAQIEIRSLKIPFECSVCHSFAAYRSARLRKNWCIQHYSEYYDIIKKQEGL